MGVSHVWPVSDATIGKGDVNEDGPVNLTDALLSLQVLAGIAPNRPFKKPRT